MKKRRRSTSVFIYGFPEKSSVFPVFLPDVEDHGVAFRRHALEGDVARCEDVPAAFAAVSLRMERFTAGGDAHRLPRRKTHLRVGRAAHDHAGFKRCGSFLRRIGLADKIERVGMLGADGIHGQNEGEYQRNAQQCVVKFRVFPVVFNQMLTSIAASKCRGETVFAVKWLQIVTLCL